MNILSLIIQKVKNFFSKKRIDEPIPLYLEKYDLVVILRIDNKGVLSCQFEKSDKYTDEEVVEEISNIIIDELKDIRS